MNDILSSKPVTQPEPSLYKSTSPRSPRDTLKYLLPQVRPYGKTKSPYSQNPRTPKQRKFAAKQKSQARQSASKFGETRSLGKPSQGASRNLEATKSKGDRALFDFSNIHEFDASAKPSSAKSSATRKVQFSASKGEPVRFFGFSVSRSAWCREQLSVASQCLPPAQFIFTLQIILWVDFFFFLCGASANMLSIHYEPER